jgi:hypothetical protein
LDDEQTDEMNASDVAEDVAGEMRPVEDGAAGFDVASPSLSVDEVPMMVVVMLPLFGAERAASELGHPPFRLRETNTPGNRGFSPFGCWGDMVLAEGTWWMSMTAADWHSATISIPLWPIVVKRGVLSE